MTSSFPTPHFTPHSLPTVQGRVTAKSNAQSAKASSSNEASASISKLASGRAPAPAKYRVDKGPNAARKRARDTIAPLNNSTYLRTH